VRSGGKASPNRWKAGNSGRRSESQSAANASDSIRIEISTRRRCVPRGCWVRTIFNGVNGLPTVDPAAMTIGLVGCALRKRSQSCKMSLCARSATTRRTFHSDGASAVQLLPLRRAAKVEHHHFGGVEKLELGMRDLGCGTYS